MNATEQIDMLGDFILENFDEEIIEGGAVEVAMKSMKQWRDIAMGLWRILDDVDTLDDACKDNDALFRRQAEIQVSKRHSILPIVGRMEERYKQYLERVNE